MGLWHVPMQMVEIRTCREQNTDGNVCTFVVPAGVSLCMSCIVNAPLISCTVSRLTRSAARSAGDSDELQYGSDLAVALSQHRTGGALGGDDSASRHCPPDD